MKISKFRIAGSNCCWGEVINGEVDGGEIGDLPIAAETEVGEAVSSYIGGIWGVRVGEVPSWEG